MTTSNHLGLVFTTDFWKKQLDFFLLVIVICEVIHDPHKWINVIFIALCFAGFLPQIHLRKNLVFWAVLAGLYLLTKNGYPLLANHHFLIFYLLLSKVFHIYFKLNEQQEAQVYKVYFSIIMLVAAIYKLQSSDLMNGSVYYYMWVNNMLFESVTPYVYESYSVLTADNVNALEGLFQRNKGSITLDKGPLDLLPFFKLYTWTAVILELLVSFLFWTPWTKMTHIIVLLFIFLVPLATTEFTFLSLVSLLALSQVNEHSRSFAWIYAGLLLFYTSLSLY
ncbi:MAG: hypothetical protein ACON42_08950 [Flavobacteriaceae bacterium]